jgi:hypothetical protein
MAGIRANHTNDAFAFDDFAVFAKLFYGSAHFHILIFQILLFCQTDAAF